jgi:hypothetical protein
MSQIECVFVKPNLIPQGSDWSELRGFYDILLEDERGQVQACT